MQIQQDKLCLFDFWAAWCAPCKKISPVYEKLSAVTHDVNFYKINVEEQPDIVDEVIIRGVRSSTTLCHSPHPDLVPS